MKKLTELLKRELDGLIDPDHYLNNNNEAINQNFLFIERPLFNIQEIQAVAPNLSYRKINDWDSKGLITSFRKTSETGWRKFSIVELVKLLIILDLRKFGFSTDKITTILSEIFSESNTGHTKFDGYTCLRDNILLSFIGTKIILVIYEDGNISFRQEDDFVKRQFVLNDINSSFLILPFFSYIQKISKHILNRDIKIDTSTTVKEIYLSDEERKALAIIRNGNYKEIEIEMLNLEAESDDSDLISYTIVQGSSENILSENDAIRMIKNRSYQFIEIFGKNNKSLVYLSGNRIRLSHNRI